VRKTRLLIFGLFLLVPFFVLVEKSSLREITRPSSPPKNLYLLETVFRYIRNDYIEDLDPVRTVDGSFRGLVNSLDACSGYLDKQVTARYFEQKESVPAEPGLILFKKYGAFPAVTGLIENSPAEKEGLQLGDTITEIDRSSTSSMSLTEVKLLLRGREREPVELKILRGDKTLEMKVARANLTVDPVSYFAQEGTAGVLRIARIASPLLKIVRTDLLPRLIAGDQSLVIDLRNCQEGTFEEARQFVNLFLRTESIGYLEKAGDKKLFFSSLEEPVLPNTPLIIWVSQATMGPAEAVAAVLRESGRARIVGIPTLGLAAQSEFFALPDGTSLVLTSGVFCLHSGVRLWGRGVEPDVRVEVEDLSPGAYLKKSKSLLSLP